MRTEHVLLSQAATSDSASGDLHAAATWLREHLPTVFGDLVEERPADPAAWAVLRDAAGAAVARGELHRDDGVARLVWTDTVDGVLDHCWWFFLDRSWNGGRRWCAVEDCGRTEGIRRITARRTGARGGAS